MFIFNQICAAFGIAATGQLHHFGPLIKPTKFIAFGGVIVIAITFNDVVIVLIVFTINHGTDIQVFSHNSHRGIYTTRSFTFNSDVVIAAAISFIGKLFIGIRPHFTCSRVRF